MISSLTVCTVLVCSVYLVASFPTMIVPTTPPSPPGCYYNGKHYAPNSDMGSGYDASSNWCYGAHCDSTGQVIHWDNFHCKTTTITPGPPPTTTPMGCYYNNKWYAPGTMIDEGYDASSNWCYFTQCGQDGNILNGDNFNCKTTPPTTVPPTTVPPNPMVG